MTSGEVNRLTWHTRRELEYEVLRALCQLVKIGFPVPDTALIPAQLFVLPRFHAALKRNTPPNALAQLLTEAIDAFNDGEDAAFDLYHDLDDARAQGKLIQDVLRLYFGLHPETSGLDHTARWNRADPTPPRKTRNGPGWVVIEPVFPELVEYLCVGAPEASPYLPDLAELVFSLNYVVKDGLPLTEETATPTLLAFLPLVPYAESHPERIIRMNAYLHDQLSVFELEYLSEAAQILFAAAPGTKATDVSMREQKVAGVLPKGNSVSNIRRGIRAKIVNGFAWQLYRSKVAEREY